MGAWRRARTLIAALAITQAPTPAVGHAGPAYTALGDSYSSGLGTRTYYADSGSCRRSPVAYPVKVASQKGYTLSFAACSGAKSGDVINHQLGSLNGSTRSVTISIGGNDAGFSSVIASCARPWPWTCWSDIDDAEYYMRSTLPGRLDGVYSQIRRRAPSAKVEVIGYPRIFNQRDTCNVASRISAGEQVELNGAADLLATTTAGRASAYGFGYVDPRSSFAGHAVCHPVAWINGLSYPVSESYHPNASGQTAYADLVAPALW